MIPSALAVALGDASFQGFDLRVIANALIDHDRKGEDVSLPRKPSGETPGAHCCLV